VEAAVALVSAITALVIAATVLYAVIRRGD
jgi:hypothetical protein